MKHSLLAATLFTVFTGCTDKAVLRATDEHNKQLVRTYFNEAWNKGNVSVLDTLLSRSAWLNKKRAQKCSFLVQSAVSYQGKRNPNPDRTSGTRLYLFLVPATGVLPG